MNADYAKATEDERAILCNGCGPQNLPWLRPFIPQMVFTEAGNRHDWDYHVGGGYQEYARANLRFLANCLAAVADRSPWRWMWWHLVGAFAYYMAVKFGGYASFDWGPVRSMDDMRLLSRRIIERKILQDLAKELEGT